ncbi:MAG: hypothetical protein M3Y56_10250, partial [Armatimonadota bacterium]|nr:hypothetical protein [Armatimonadota bacterium]
FTPELGLTLLGQMHERRGERVRDPLMASAVAFGDDAGVLVIVSVDICMLSTPFVRMVQQEWAQQTSLPPGSLLLHATHTHVAPTEMTLLAAEAGPQFVDRLRQAIVQAALEAFRRMEPGDVYAGTGRMEEMGWNRRAMFADGSSVMYGRASDPGFVGLEGPRDPALSVLFHRCPQGGVRGVVVNFSTHPNTLENECFYSADIPGEVRRVLKRTLGPDMVVVYLTGAAGNTAPSILDPPVEQQPWRGEEGLARSGLYMAGETLRVLAACTEPMPHPTLGLENFSLRIPIREWPHQEDRSYPQPLLQETWAAARPYYEQAEKDWLRRLAEESPVDVRLTVARVGDAVFCTNPAELFVEFGLQIRENSPARVTFISELTDGYVGYVPTTLAFSRGGYETWPAPTSQLVPEAGELIVEATEGMMGRVFGG